MIDDYRIDLYLDPDRNGWHAEARNRFTNELAFRSRLWPSSGEAYREAMDWLTDRRSEVPAA